MVRIFFQEERPAWIRQGKFTTLDSKFLISAYISNGAITGWIGFVENVKELEELTQTENLKKAMESNLTSYEYDNLMPELKEDGGYYICKDRDEVWYSFESK